MLELLTEALELLTEYMPKEKLNKYADKFVDLSREEYKLKGQKKKSSHIAKKTSHMRNRLYQRLDAINRLRSKGKLKKETKE